LAGTGGGFGGGTVITGAFFFLTSTGLATGAFLAADPDDGLAVRGPGKDTRLTLMAPGSSLRFGAISGSHITAPMKIR